MAQKNQAFEEIARHVMENLPQYMPYIKYAGVFLVGFVSGMLWSQHLAEEEAAAKPRTQQTKKTSRSSAKVVKDDAGPSKTKKKTASKTASKLFDAPEAETEPEAATPGSFVPEQVEPR